MFLSQKIIYKLNYFKIQLILALFKSVCPFVFLYFLRRFCSEPRAEKQPNPRRDNATCTCYNFSSLPSPDFDKVHLKFAPSLKSITKAGK